MAKEMEKELGPYLLRTVRVGLVATAMIVTALAIIPFTQGSPVTNTAAYFGVLGMAAVGAVVVSTLPWASLFERGWGLPMMYAWSVADIVLVTLLLAPSGGGRSSAFWVYLMTTIFAVASYPDRAQVLLTGGTATAYLALCAVTDSFPSTASLVMRLSVLVAVAYMSSFLSRELKREISGHRSARAQAETNAEVLGQIAESARHVNDLDPERAKTAVLTALEALGFPAASICVLEEGGRWFRHASARGFDAPPSHRLLPSAEDEVVRIVVRSGRPLIIRDGDPEAEPARIAYGVRGIIAAPIRVDGVVEAVLVGGTPEPDHVAEAHIEPFELLASLAGRAMGNATRFQVEHDAARRLAEVDAMKSDFLTTVSQELRTPLTAITGVGELLVQRWDTIDDDTRRELLVQSNANAEELRRIILTMLDLSLIQAGTLTSVLEVVDLSALLRNAVSKTEKLLADHHVSVVVPDDLRVVADPAMLARVIDSLLVNVARHTAPGTAATVTARAHRGTVRVVVADDGPGIAPELRQALGTMFLRGGKLHARVRGLGLGIALSMEVLKLHGSTLEIESTVGLGTQCAFTLPESTDHVAQRADAIPVEGLGYR